MALNCTSHPWHQQLWLQVGPLTEWESRGDGGGTCPVVSTKLHLGSNGWWVGWLVDGELIKFANLVGWLIVNYQNPQKYGKTRFKKNSGVFKLEKMETTSRMWNFPKRAEKRGRYLEFPRVLPSNLRIPVKQASRNQPRRLFVVAHVVEIDVGCVTSNFPGALKSICLPIFF